MNSKYLVYISILALAVLAVFIMARSPLENNGRTANIEFGRSIDGKKSIDITVTLPQIKKEISPIAIDEFLSNTKIASAKEGGLKLIDFKTNSVLTKYGFNKGDIIKEVNGRKLNSLDDAIEACELLEKEIFNDRDAKEIHIALNRDGEDIDVRFKIPQFTPEKVSYTMRLEKADR